MTKPPIPKTDFFDALKMHDEFTVIARRLANAGLIGVTHGAVSYLKLKDQDFYGLRWEFSTLIRNPDYASGESDDPFAVKLDTINVGHQVRIGNA